MVNLNTQRWYGTQRANIKSSFRINQVHYTRIRLIGEDFDRVVETSNLTEQANPELVIPEESEVPIGGDSDTEEVEQETPQEDDVEETDEQTEEQPEEEAGDESGDTSDDQEDAEEETDTEDNAEQIEEQPQDDNDEFNDENEEAESSEPVVFAVATSGDEEFDLGTVDQLADNENVQQLELDPAAIQRVLDGEQGTHRGFTFELRGE